MTFTGYLELGGNEIVNNLRVSTYAANLGIAAISCGDCSALRRTLGDNAYSSPDMDNAPWWDPSVTSSKDFAGVLGLEITGLDAPVNVREAIPLAGDGAALSPVRRRQREILVRALLLARTEAALSYGRTWMAAAVRGGLCGLGCVGEELCFLASCPECPDFPEPGEPDTCGDAEWRQAFNVGILEGPTPQAARKIHGGWIQEVQFTLTAGNPFIYRLPAHIANGPTPGQVIPQFAPELPYCRQGQNPETDNCIRCEEDVDCIADATENLLCRRLPAPLIPLVPADPCFPTGPFTAYRAVVPIPAGKTPLWLETVPYMRIKVGPRKMERFTLRFYNNQSGIDCFDGLEDPDWQSRQIGPCDACVELHIPTVPPNSTLTLDGRIQRAWVDCPGGPGLSTAEPFLYSRAGASFQWPVFGCGMAMCLEIITAVDPVTSQPPQASWEIFLVPREDAT